MFLVSGGLVAFTKALAMLYQMLVFYRRSELVNGKIIGAEFVKNSSGRSGYAAVIEYTVKDKTQRNTRQRMRAAQLKNESGHRIGAEIGVRYAMQNPQFARVNSFAEIWLEPLAGITLGLALITVGLAFLDKL